MKFLGEQLQFVQVKWDLVWMMKRMEIRGTFDVTNKQDKPAAAAQTLSKETSNSIPEASNADDPSAVATFKANLPLAPSSGDMTT